MSIGIEDGIAVVPVTGSQGTAPSRLRVRERKERMMRVFIAGATGAIGDRLVPQLVERGHEVIGTSRSPEKAERLRAGSARPSPPPGRTRSSTKQPLSPV
jgi:NADPH-dependent curcumin reductase CurA